MSDDPWRVELATPFRNEKAQQRKNNVLNENEKREFQGKKSTGVGRKSWSHLKNPLPPQLEKECEKHERILRDQDLFPHCVHVFFLVGGEGGFSWDQDFLPPPVVVLGVICGVLVYSYIFFLSFLLSAVFFSLWCRWQCGERQKPKMNKYIAIIMDEMNQKQSKRHLFCCERTRKTTPLNWAKPLIAAT